MKKNKLPATRRSAIPTHRGFTLVEVLTVIAIISILMTAGAIGLGNLTAGKGTSSAIATCESLFEEARTIAVSKRCSARVMIEVEANPKRDTYLRRIVIAHQKLDDKGEVEVPESWVLASRGYTMPKGTFFSTEFSKTTSGKIGEETLAAGAGISSTYAGKYATYEFNSEGIITNPGASFIIGSGVLPKTSAQPRAASGAERDFAGFVIWRNGRTSTYRSPEQMGLPAKVTNF